jgi:hypothetical protein
MGHGFYKGIPYISISGVEKKDTCLIRIPVELKARLECIKKELQRDSWSYVSYGDVIEYFLKKLVK